MLGQLLHDALRLRRVAVHLVQRHDHRHAGRLGVADGLDSLRHHLVVGRDDEDDEVRHLGATGAHGRKRLVTRRVQERDRAVAGNVHLVGADVLRDAAGLAGHDVLLADVVEQRRLAVVDVAHDGDHRGAPFELLGRVLGDLDGDFVEVGDELDVAAELVGDERDRVGVEALVDRDHDAESKALLDDLGHRDGHELGELGGGDELHHAQDGALLLHALHLLLAVGRALGALGTAALLAPALGAFVDALERLGDVVLDLGLVDLAAAALLLFASAPVSPAGCRRGGRCCRAGLLGGRLVGGRLVALALALAAAPLAEVDAGQVDLADHLGAGEAVAVAFERAFGKHLFGALGLLRCSFCIGSRLGGSVGRLGFRRRRSSRRSVDGCGGLCLGGCLRRRAFHLTRRFSSGRFGCCGLGRRGLGSRRRSDGLLGRHGLGLGLGRLRLGRCFGLGSGRDGRCGGFGRGRLGDRLQISRSGGRFGRGRLSDGLGCRLGLRRRRRRRGGRGLCSGNRLSFGLRLGGGRRRGGRVVGVLLLAQTGHALCRLAVVRVRALEHVVHLGRELGVDVGGGELRVQLHPFLFQGVDERIGGHVELFGGLEQADAASGAGGGGFRGGHAGDVRGTGIPKRDRASASGRATEGTANAGGDDSFPTRGGPARSSRDRYTDRAL